MKIVIYLYCYDAFLFKNASAFLLRDLCYTMHSILLHVLVIISLGNQAGILVHLIAEYFTDYSFQTYNFIKEAQSQSRNQLCATF